MASNYENPAEDETTPQTFKTIPCHRCYGTGTIEIDGWPTDCIDCEGWGDVEVPD